MNTWAWVGDFLDAWGAAMWRASWQAALLVGVAICIARAPLISATIRSWVWRVAYLKFLLALLPFGLPLAILPQATVDRTEFTLAAKSDAVDNSVLRSTERHGLSSNKANIAASQETFGWSTWLCGGLFAVWFVGCAWRVRIAARGWREMLVIKRRGHVPPKCELTRVFAGLCRQMGIARPPVLLLVNRINGPMLVGGPRPAVLFPPDLLPSCTVDDVTLMLRHELAHYQRGDLGWSILAATVDVLFFFHPAVRLVHRHYAVAQEVACDRLALRGAGQSASSYARMIVRIAESQTQNYPWVTAHVTGAYSDLRERLTAMANLQTQRGQWRCLGGGLAVLIVAALVLPVRLVEADDASSSESGTSSSDGSSGISGSLTVKKKNKIKKSATASASASSAAGGGTTFNGIVAQNQAGGSGDGRGQTVGGGSGSAFGGVQVQASAVASTGDDDDSPEKSARPSIGPSPGAPAARTAVADNISIVSRKVGRKRTTTVTEDERTIVLSDSPNRIAINIIDESTDPPKVTHFAAESEEALAKKHPLAYELYRKYVLDRREGAADGRPGAAIGGEGILGGGGRAAIRGGGAPAGVGGSSFGGGAGRPGGLGTSGGGAGSSAGPSGIGGDAAGGSLGGGGGTIGGAAGTIGGAAGGGGSGLSGAADLGGGGALGGKAGAGVEAARLMREQLQKLRDEADTDDLRKLIDEALEQVK